MSAYGASKSLAALVAACFLGREYGGVITATVTVVVIAKRRGLPLGQLAGVAAVPLFLAYGIGRLVCLLAGDGS